MFRITVPLDDSYLDSENQKMDQIPTKTTETTQSATQLPTRTQDTTQKTGRSATQRPAQTTETTQSATQFTTQLPGLSPDRTAKTTQSARPGNLKAELDITALMRQNPSISQKQIAEQLNRNVNTVKYYIRKMQEQGKVERVGSFRKGKWIVK